MSVAGISYAASTGAENINTIEIVQGLTNLVRPLLSLSSVGFALAGKSALGALAAGLVAASDSRLSGYERWIEGAKASIGFVPFIGSAVQILDGLCGVFTQSRLGSGVSMSKDESGFSCLMGVVGVAFDSIVHFKLLSRFPVPGMCGVTATEEALDGVSIYNKIEGETVDQYLLRLALGLPPPKARLVVEQSSVKVTRGASSVVSTTNFGLKAIREKYSLSPGVFTDDDLARGAFDKLTERQLDQLRIDLENFGISTANNSDRFGNLIEIIEEIMDARASLDAVA